ncbi:ROK family protein [Streptomyces sp. E1N211]|uniref:ROK family protein n=1 Tax=Streptomyces sp. E1N211 TaxID=1851876 RepID=UPI000EF6C596|nr:ROK family protein [Streptomyces sp. E1N211]
MHTDLVAALDIGGTKIAGALVDREGRILARAQRPTPAREDGDTVMAAVGAVIGDLAASPLWERAGAVGIGSAGPVDASAGTVSPVNVPGWRDYPLVAQVRDAAGGLPVALIGDGVAITAAEHWQGAARGHDNALCMVVSTGVGGGLVLGGRLHPGPTGNAGHIGHISVDLDGDPCPCAAARAGDPVAVASYERAARALAAGIAATATLVEIDIAVIGGGVGKAGEVLFAPLRKALTEFATLSFVRRLAVVPARTGTDAGLVGAAAAALMGRTDASPAAADA